ncbi:MAG: hypothetical protein IH586_03825 [Anaerolineaceae bacterium]|nr:hypothetical protein [Anaerolineaceae bacterium]
MRKIYLWTLLFPLLLAACGVASPAVPTITATVMADTMTPEPSATPIPSATPSPTTTNTASPVPTQTQTPTVTLTPTITQTPTRSPTPTITVTPTRVYPDVVVKEQANCRYGPSVAYLYRWGLYEGDTAKVHGRNWNGTWYWIKPFNLDTYCWASEIVFKERVDAMALPYIQPRLPKTTFAGPPSDVKATRNGNQVTITWVSVPLSDDKRRGNLIEATQCIDGNLIFQPYQTDGSEITLQDDKNCSKPSGALLYTAEKHGYSDPVQVPWP